MKCKKYNGFTQLQTLCIIGIVFLVIFAMIAVPFYKSYKQKQSLSKLKVLYATLVQANRVYSLSNDANAEEYDTYLHINDFAEKYFTPYLQIFTICKNGQDSCWNNPQYMDLANNKIYNKALYSIVLDSNVILGFHKDKNGLISIIADIDGKSGDNKLGHDVFVFSFYNDKNVPKLCDKEVYTKYYIKNGLHFGGYDECGIPMDSYSYSELLSDKLKDSCNKKASASANGLGVGSACLALIYKSTWAIDKIYPW